jgi:hypothetical protein
MKLIIAGLAAFALAAPAVVFAADAPAAATPAAAVKPSVETTTIGELVDNPKAKAVLEKDNPVLLAYEGLDQIRGMTLRQISAFPQAQQSGLNDDKLKAIQADFDAIQ